MTGTVFVSVTRSVGQEEWAGAQDVWEVDLSGATDGRLGMITAGNYGHTVYGGTLHAHSASLNIGGSVLKPIDVASSPNFNITHDVLSPVTLDDVDGNLTVGGTVADELLVFGIGGNASFGSVDGSVVICYPGVSGAVTVDGDIDGFMSLWSCTGAVTVDGLVSGDFWCGVTGGDVQFTATGTHTGDITMCPLAEGRTLEVLGSCEGTILISGRDHETTVHCAGPVNELIVNDGADASGPVTLDQGAASITLSGWGSGYPFAGDLTVTGDVGAIETYWGIASGGHVSVDGELGLFRSVAAGLAGALSIATVPQSAAVQIAGGPGMAGTLNITSLTGEVALADGVTGTIEIADLAGTVSVGNVYLQPPFAGSLNIGTMTGNVLLWNGFANNTALDPDVAEVQIGTKAADALFVVNDDGRNRGDEYWQSGAAVQIGTEPPYSVYWGPNEGQNLWEASCCKADTDNSGALNAFDIDPFVLLLTDPAAYCAIYPGLCGSGYDPEEGPGGSALYRGDLNCDGEINSFDIDPFVLKLTDPDAWYALHPKRCASMVRECCPSCGENDLFADMSEMAEAEDDSLLVDTGEADADALVSGTSPGAVAEVLGASVAPEHFANLLSLVQDAATQSGDTPRGAFWAAVAEQLSGE